MNCTGQCAVCDHANISSDAFVGEHARVYLHTWYYVARKHSSTASARGMCDYWIFECCANLINSCISRVKAPQAANCSCIKYSISGHPNSHHKIQEIPVLNTAFQEFPVLNTGTCCSKYRIPVLNTAFQVRHFLY